MALYRAQYDDAQLLLTPTTMMSLFLIAIGLVISLAISLLVAVPIAGVLVRFRANYTPKGLQLDGEGGVQPHTGPVVNSYFAMFKRVKRLEGWAGLYKGFMPSVLSTVAIMLFLLVLPDTSLSNPSGHRKYSAPINGLWNRLAYSLFMMIISLPVVIITNRSITTPFRLPWINGLFSLRALLTSSERRRPWLLFLTPGLLVSEALRILYVVLVLDPLHSLIFPPQPIHDDGAPLTFKYFTLPRLSLYMLLVFVSTVIIVPLEVISTRLSIQRNHASADFEDENTTLDAPYAGADEDVIGLRSEDDPYVGFTDCLQRVVNEEGYKVLFRAWWLVTIPLLAMAAN